MQYSFYGGQQGQSFKISAVFNTKIDLVADLNARYSSSIGVGEFVIVSYGLPNAVIVDPTTGQATLDQEYSDNAQADIAKYNRSYNTTLWQKIYLEEGASDERYPLDAHNFELIFPDKATYGIAYKLIAAMTGNTPHLSLAPTVTLDVNEKPRLELDLSNMDFPVLKFFLPRAQKIKYEGKVTLDANEAPVVHWTDTDTSGAGTSNGAASNTVNEPKLKFDLPRAQVVLQKNVSTTILRADKDPEVVWDATDTSPTSTNGAAANTVNEPKVTFKIPQAQVIDFQEFDPAKNVLDVNEQPRVEWAEGQNADDSINNPTLEFFIPRSQKIKYTGKTTLDANEAPEVNWDDTDTDTTTTNGAATNTVNEPTLHFKLPRAQKINYTGFTVKDADFGKQASDKLVEWDDTDTSTTTTNGNASNTVNEPTLHFNLPQSQKILPEHVTVTLLDSGDTPAIVFSTTGTNSDGTSKINQPSLEFKIPLSQKIDFTGHTVLNADQAPKVRWTDTDEDGAAGGNQANKRNSPQLHFDLPQAQQILPAHIKYEVLKAGQKPVFIFNTIGQNLDGTHRINQPEVTIKLPASQVIGVDNTIDVLHADQGPYVTLDDTDKDNPVLTFHLPKAQILGLGNFSIADAETEPTVGINSSDIDNPKLDITLPRMWKITAETKTASDANQAPKVVLNKEDINNLVLEFTLPKAQILTLGEFKILNADETPTFAIDSSDINNPKIKIGLPQSQILKLGAVSALDADAMPTVEIDDNNINRPKLNFGLPQQQILKLEDTEVLPPQEAPDVTLDDETNINRPTLQFKLPRAIRIGFGTGLLGKRYENNGRYTKLISEVVQTVTDEFLDRTGQTLIIDQVTQIAYILGIEDAKFYLTSSGLNLDVGDFYIDEPTGFVYTVIDKTDTEITFWYVASLQAPLPAVEIKSTIDPFVETDTVNHVFEHAQPDVSADYLDTTEKTGQKIVIDIPKAPELLADATEVAPLASATANVKPVSETEIKFDFEIPRGSRVLVGTKVTTAGQANSPAITEDVTDITTGAVTTITAENGDIYLNGETGDVFRLRNGIWMHNKEDNIRGPEGKALKIVASYSYHSDGDYSTYGIVGRLNNNKNDLLTLVKKDVLNAPEATPTPGLGRLPSNDEIILVTYVDDDVTGDLGVSYWAQYYYDQTTHSFEWRLALLTGYNDLIVSEYRNPGEDNKTYSTKYINGLIGGNITTDYDKKAFSVEQVLKMLEWGDMSKANTDVIPGEPGDHDSLSAEEMLELLSWGSIAKQALKDTGYLT